jgi:hypothetical protein
MKHTPGPWRIINGDGEYQKRIISDSIACTLAVVYADAKQHKKGMAWDHANAYLIASAPELLEACKAVVKQWDYDTFGRWKMRRRKSDKKEPITVSLCREAIEKAEGKE